MSGRPSAIVDPWPRRMEEIFSPRASARLRELVDVVWGRNEPIPGDAFADALSAAEAIVCGDWRAASCTVDHAPGLRAILGVTGRFPTGVDYERCRVRGIRLLSCAPAFARQVAEMGLAMALASGRRIVEGHERMRAGNERYLHAGNAGATLLYDKRVGMVGYGNIGRELRRLLVPFGCRVVAADPWVVDGVLVRDNVEPMELDVLLSSCDVVFALAAPSVENAAMLSAERLDLLAPGTLLVLLSRAQVVDFDALTDRLLQGRFRAALDVFPTEPLAEEHPIRHAPGTILSAHLAGSVAEGLCEIGDLVVEDLEAVLRGLPPRSMQNGEPELLGRYTRAVAAPPSAAEREAARG